MPRRRPRAGGLSFTETHRLDALPAEIDRLTEETPPGRPPRRPRPLHAAPVKFRKGAEMLAQRQAALGAAEEEWLALEACAGG